VPAAEVLGPALAASVASNAARHMESSGALELTRPISSRPASVAASPAASPYKMGNAAAAAAAGAPAQVVTTGFRAAAAAARPSALFDAVVAMPLPPPGPPAPGVRVAAAPVVTRAPVEPVAPHSATAASRTRVVIARGPAADAPRRPIASTYVAPGRK